MKNDLIRIEILDDNSAIIHEEYFDKYSDNIDNMDRLYGFLDENKGEFTISIEHFKAVQKGK